MFANIAVKNFIESRLGRTSFAAINVNLPIVENRVLTMKQGSAKFAGENLSQTNIQVGNAALGNAPVFFVGIKKIRPCGKQPVYNMEVDEYHNFSVNGGIIVHNCMDAVRYFANTVMWREI